MHYNLWFSPLHHVPPSCLKEKLNIYCKCDLDMQCDLDTQYKHIKGPHKCFHEISKIVFKFPSTYPDSELFNLALFYYFLSVCHRQIDSWFICESVCTHSELKHYYPQGGEMLFSFCFYCFLPDFWMMSEATF